VQPEDNSTSPWLEFKLNKQLRDAIAEAGFETPTEIQRKCIPLIGGGQDVIGIAQTGTGKTAAYLLPILMKIKYAQGSEPRVLILGPTKELIVQLSVHAAALAAHTDIRIIPLYAGVGPNAQIATIRNGVDILIATPGRFMELYRRNEIPVKGLKTLVLDEADRMMDIGFMPQLRRIFEVIPSRRQNLLFSATFSSHVQRLSEEFLEFPVTVEVTPQATPAQQVAQAVYRIPNVKTKINFLDHLLTGHPDYHRVLVFTRTKETADNVFKFLDRKKLGPVRVIHANKEQNSRINAMNEFKEGKLRVLVSTDVSARGIDVADVSHVINFDVPSHYEDYVHRIGRTGRASREGIAMTFATPAEEYHIARIEKLIRGKIPVEKLPSTIEIAETPFAEAQAIAREIDRQKRLLDPTFKGAFHERQ
jgi:ATP-dependent RNA helicase RhlE